jgi:hypothetical protein
MNKVAIAILLLLPSAAATAQPNETVIVIEPGTQPVTVAPMPPSGPGAMPPAAQPAPQNEDWNNVSHVNGTPVPVGDRNQYVYRFRKTNISSNPVGWLLGFYGLSVSYALSENIAIRGDLNYMAIANSSVTGAELGIGLPIYLRRTYQGPFIEPGLITRTFNDNFDGGSSSSTTAGPQMLVGWHWMYDSGLNLAIALGAGRNFSSNQSNSDYSHDEPFAAGYFRVGYAF